MFNYLGTKRRKASVVVVDHVHDHHGDTSNNNNNNDNFGLKSLQFICRRSRSRSRDRYRRRSGRSRERYGNRQRDRYRRSRSGDRRRSRSRDRRQSFPKAGRSPPMRRSPSPFRRWKGKNDSPPFHFGPMRRPRSPDPEPPTEDKDRRTVMCMQLAANVDRDVLIDFFKPAGKVRQPLYTYVV